MEMIAKIDRFSPKSKLYLIDATITRCVKVNQETGMREMHVFVGRLPEHDERN